MISYSHMFDNSPPQHPVFRSFWMGGYECTDQLNCFGNRVDFLKVTGHDQMAKEDYDQLSPFNIRTVREGICWSKVEKRPYQYDWTAVSAMMDTGKACGIQQIWDICHFGFADDLTPLHPMFARRFAALCRAFVNFYRSKYPDEPLIVTPINEVSFLSWLGGDAVGTAPYCNRQGWEVKYGLMRAYIEGVAAMKEIDPSVKIMSTEPLANIIPALDANDDMIQRAKQAHEDQYQAMDMLTGRICPELGGSPAYLDLLGLNYYYNNQWVWGSGQFISWLNEPFDSRWRPLRSLLQEAYNRYRVPFLLSETSHPKEDRPLWINFITTECAAIIEKGLPFVGICLYPIIDRPDWDHLTPWHQAGLWDAEPAGEGLPPKRVLYEPYAAELLKSQKRIEQAMKKRDQRKAVGQETEDHKIITESFTDKPFFEIPKISKIG